MVENIIKILIFQFTFIGFLFFSLFLCLISVIYLIEHLPSRYNPPILKFNQPLYCLIFNYLVSIHPSHFITISLSMLHNLIAHYLLHSYIVFALNFEYSQLDSLLAQASQIYSRVHR